MNIEMILNILACLAIIVFGLYALLKPREAAQMAHMTLNDATATAETRITFGGISIGAGAAPLLINQPIAFQTIGLLWLLTFVVRLIATALDRPALARTYVVSGAFEIVVGLILFLS